MINGLDEATPTLFAAACDAIALICFRNPFKPDFVPVGVDGARTEKWTKFAVGKSSLTKDALKHNVRILEVQTAFPSFH